MVAVAWAQRHSHQLQQRNQSNILKPTQLYTLQFYAFCLSPLLHLSVAINRVISITVHNWSNFMAVICLAPLFTTVPFQCLMGHILTRYCESPFKYCYYHNKKHQKPCLHECMFKWVCVLVSVCVYIVYSALTTTKYSCIWHIGNTCMQDQLASIKLFFTIVHAKTYTTLWAFT